MYSQVPGLGGGISGGHFSGYHTQGTSNTTFGQFRQEGTLSWGMTSQPALHKALYSGRRDKREGRLARPTNEPSKGTDSVALESTQPPHGPLSKAKPTHDPREQPEPQR